MQSLNWLLNVLSPTTTKKPKLKPKASQQLEEPIEQDIFSHQPTHLTPVVTALPPSNIINSLSQQDIKKLIKELEEIQKDPSGKRALDFSSINSLQNLIQSDQGVQVRTSGATGTKIPSTTTVQTTTFTKRATASKSKSTTVLPLSVSNSLLDDDDDSYVSTTTQKPKISLAPVKLRPVPGIDDNDNGTMIRGQLINAAVNVTRAISSFLGTALQVNLIFCY